MSPECLPWQDEVKRMEKQLQYYRKVIFLLSHCPGRRTLMSVVETGNGQTGTFIEVAILGVSTMNLNFRCLCLLTPIKGMWNEFIWLRLGTSCWLL
jgi:hypothetical protein